MPSNIDFSSKNIGFIAPDILLPNKTADMYRWATVACDQYTSDPAYWEDVENITKNTDSTYDLMLPEIYLEQEGVDHRIAQINQNMRDYIQKNFFIKYSEAFILTRRNTPFSPVRTGLVAALDLERYDFHKGAKALIRATEGTVTERIPPRMKIRKNAVLEMPHIMILIDDPGKTVIEPAAEALLSGPEQPLYDTDLMKNGGHISGYLIQEKSNAKIFHHIFEALEALNRNADGFLFAVGDGNHSLASAKCHYEDLKRAGLPCRNARYAMVEIVNLHDQGILFEPIHRVLFGADPGQLTAFLESKGCLLGGTAPECHCVPYITSAGEGRIAVPKAIHTLAAGALQTLLDEYLRQNPSCRIDYIHGEDAVRRLGMQAGNVGFFLPAMDKNELFPTVSENGALPRKTFSMGEACEKRYYMECRIIVDNLK
ncbi:MAG: DUF1015 domain-containing protein [Clostridia bacterium]